MNKGIVSDVRILMLLEYSQADFIIHIFNCFHWFERMVMQVQRILNLLDAPQEKIEGTAKPKSENWSKQGTLEFKDVVLRYRPNTDIVLNNVSFKANPGEKVGVVGRTGAGKSTLTMALTRIVELESGKIFIDDEDISNLNLDTLRGAMTMIPQDPTLFTGTLRHNVDPFEECTDELITELLKKAGLEYLFEGKSKQEKEEEEKEKADKMKRFNMTEEELEEKEKKDKEKEEKDDDKSKDDKSKDEKAKDEKKDDEKKEDDKDKKEKTKEELEQEKKDSGKGLYFKVKEEGNNLSIGEK